MSKVTKGERQIIKMLDKYQIKIINEELKIYKSLWTSEQGKDKSVTDHHNRDDKYIATIKGVCSNQNEKYVTFKIEIKESRDIKTYTQIITL